VFGLVADTLCSEVRTFRALRLHIEPQTRLYWDLQWRSWTEQTRGTMARAAAAYDVRFEDACADPVGVAIKIAEGLQLWNSVCPDRAKDVSIEAFKASE
jgi:hypothetical protein